MNHITREDAFTLLKEYNKDPFHIQHALTVEAVMKWYARELEYQDQEEYWGIVGLIWAAALMRPSKSTKDMELKSLKKKYKSKGFAAGCSREVIERGADQLGWELDKLLTMTLQAMAECENEIMEAMV